MKPNDERQKTDDEKFLQADTAHVDVNPFRQLVLGDIRSRHEPSDKLYHKRNNIEADKDNGKCTSTDSIH